VGRCDRHVSACIACILSRCLTYGVYNATGLHKIFLGHLAHQWEMWLRRQLKALWAPHLPQDRTFVHARPWVVSGARQGYPCVSAQTQVSISISRLSWVQGDYDRGAIPSFNCARPHSDVFHVSPRTTFVAAMLRLDMILRVFTSLWGVASVHGCLLNLKVELAPLNGWWNKARARLYIRTFLRA
jgi:hypothetical protein